MAADPRVRDADQVVDAPVHVLHRGAILRVTAYGRASVKGALPYRAVSGRVPRDDGEIAVGPRLADELDLHIGDRLILADTAGKRYEKRIVGVVVTPTLESEPLGRNLLMSRTALRATAISGGYSNLLVRAHDDRTAAGLSTELARDVEVEQRVAPNTIVALGKLTAPARLLVLVLLIGAMLLVAEHVALMLRRRGTQLSIAASIGMTRRQLIVSTATSALLTAAVAVLCGVPLGWAVSRVVLVEIGPRLGLGLAGPGIAPTVLVALAGFAVAAVLAFGVAALGLSRRPLTDLHSSEGAG
jgi:ABC-type antimicrobial peptide transport system permease subunit